MKIGYNQEAHKKDCLCPACRGRKGIYKESAVISLRVPVELYSLIKAKGIMPKDMVKAIEEIAK